MDLTNSCEDNSLHVNDVCQENGMNATSDSWPSFEKADGTIVKCLLNDGFLELVIMETPKGVTIDVDPDYVDLRMIEAGLKRTIKLH